ncbi:hypothetical protein GCM10010201_35470 [Pilimelia columellifera subsp. columellifera]|uniref:Secreted protein n=1 Tax=Pilimelia columellifera subsp. columellifera TaxID=706583 RepID=A0ABN3NRQ9_9ACTN
MRWGRLLGTAISFFLRLGFGTGPSGAADPADSSGKATGVCEGFTQQILNLGVRAAQLVSGPPCKCVVHGGVEPEKKLLPFGSHAYE